MTVAGPQAERLVARAREALARERASACLLSPEGVYLFCNEAWDAFAERNGGAPSCLGSAVVGRTWREFVSGDPVLAVLARVLDAAMRGAPRTVPGQCNSPTLGREMASTYQAVRTDQGEVVAVAVVHAIVREVPIELLHRPHDPEHTRYFDRAGILHMCCSCRRVQQVADRARWDFVPGYVAAMPASASHTYCRTCFDLHFAAMKLADGSREEGESPVAGRLRAPAPDRNQPA
jgi:hypothetical protein